MGTIPDTPVRVTTRGMSTVLYAAGALVFGAGASLLVFTEYTDTAFPITIDPPITAASLGAAYWAACVVEVLSARERVWANARSAVPGVLVFTVLTLVFTLLNIDQVHLRTPIGWIWLGVYGIVPPVLGGLWFAQARRPGDDPPIGVPMPGWMLASLVAFGLLALGLGAALVVAPLKAGTLWPWLITPPDARYRGIGGSTLEPYIGAWLVGLGVVALCAARERDALRLRPVFAGAITLAALEAIALVRYPDQVRWTSPAVWVYIAALSLLGALGFKGWRCTRVQSPVTPDR